jgi:hypothetical protein
MYNIILCFFSPGFAGQNGRDGINGVRGEPGYEGPPGRKVRISFTREK